MSEVTKEERQQAASDWVLGALFAALVFGSAAALTYDFLSLRDQQSAFETANPFGNPGRVDFGPRRTPGNDDQVRRYDPRSAPSRRPGQQVSLPGFDGDPDAAISASITFHIGDNGTASAVGRIDPGSFVAFEDFIDATPELTTLTFHSPGGSVRDAIAMAELLRARQINTEIARFGYCASSCPLAFSGGVERTAPDPVWFGVHQVFTSDAEIGTLQDGMAGAQHISSQAQQLLVDMGVDPRAWIHAMATPKEQLYVFSQDELAELDWITD
ncbi:MAG: hypothetical protein AB8B88_10200 [Devosiaceae bacterium]